MVLCSDINKGIWLIWWLIYNLKNLTSCYKKGERNVTSWVTSNYSSPKTAGQYKAWIWPGFFIKRIEEHRSIRHRNGVKWDKAIEKLQRFIDHSGAKNRLVPKRVILKHRPIEQIIKITLRPNLSIQESHRTIHPKANLKSHRS